MNPSFQNVMAQQPSQADLQAAQMQQQYYQQQTALQQQPQTTGLQYSAQQPTGLQQATQPTGLQQAPPTGLQYSTQAPAGLQQAPQPTGLQPMMQQPPMPQQQPILQQQPSPPDQSQQGYAQAPSNGVASIHYFDGRNYDEVVRILVEYSGFIFGEFHVDQDKLGVMLNTYINNCVRKGPPAEEQAPTGATCQHLFIKGDKNGEVCGKTAKFKGVDGLPKCSTHKTSKPSKASTSASSVTGPAGQTFSYAANAGRGKTAPQSLTTIQATIAEQAAPSQINLERAPDGRLYNPQTNLVFEQRAEGLIAVGVMNGPITTKLSVMDAHVCWGNQWRWDASCVDDQAAANAGHPLVVGEGHPLVSAGSGVMNQKIASIMNNAQ